MGEPLERLLTKVAEHERRYRKRQAAKIRRLAGSGLVRPPVTVIAEGVAQEAGNVG